MEPILQQDLTIAVPPDISVRGWPAEAGSKALAGYTALEDATVVRRLREAGAHLRASGRASEFGFGLLDERPGAAPLPPVADVAAGETAVTCAGVATGVAADDIGAPADAELVMDFMGESRLAAARASVYGFKPSYGLVSRYGLIGLIPSMECCGIVSGSLDAIGAILQTVAGQDGLDFSLPDEDPPDLSPQQIRPEETIIGVITEAQGAPASGDRQGPPAPGHAEGFRAGLEKLRRLGFTLREMSVPGYALFSLVHRVVGSVEASSAAGRYDSVRYGPRAPGAKNWNEMYLMSRGAAFGTLVKSYLVQGAFFQFERYEAFVDACRIRARLVEDMRQLESKADFFVSPMSAGPAHGAGGGAGAPAPSADEGRSATPPSLAYVYECFSSTLFANVTGQPALYMPPAPGSAQTGFQLTGPRLSDSRLLALGRLISDSRGGE
mgnify:CR=1 FL=1